MSVTLLQKETTYDVVYKDQSYQVTVLEDNVSVGYTNYDVYDEEGEVVNSSLEQEIINYLEENI
jgi:hypothetical protein